MATCRQSQRSKSNNSNNPNKNICALKVAQAIGVADEVRYLHTWSDLKRAANKGGWAFRSRKSSIKTLTVGGCRKDLKKITEKENKYAPVVAGYVIHVEGHVLLLNEQGETVVDTAPRKVDRRKIVNCYALIRRTQENISKILSDCSSGTPDRVYVGTRRIR
jgi:hypothetical protein